MIVHALGLDVEMPRLLWENSAAREAGSNCSEKPASPSLTITPTTRPQSHHPGRSPRPYPGRRIGRLQPHTYTLTVSFWKKSSLVMMGRPNRHYRGVCGARKGSGLLVAAIVEGWLSFALFRPHLAGCKLDRLRQFRQVTYYWCSQPYADQISAGVLAELKTRRKTMVKQRIPALLK